MKAVGIPRGPGNRRDILWCDMIQMYYYIYLPNHTKILSDVQTTQTHSQQAIVRTNDGQVYRRI